jgi:Ca-activated chloride channel homolog
MTDAMLQAGLLVKPKDTREPARESIPLTGVSVTARVTATANRVTVRQSYRNTEPKPLEAVYVFPLEEGAAVCGFSVTIDGRRLEGKVKPREEAFADYDDAMSEGHGAFLLDQERPNVFTASVGNLMPGQEVDIEISYVAELVPEGEGLRLTIPTTVSPRYVPAHRRNAEGLDDGDRVNPPVTLDGVSYRLDLRVEADLLSPIRSVESPSHRIHFDIDGSKVTVTLAGDEGQLDRDFVLILRSAEPFEPAARIVSGADGDRFVVASFRPRIEARRSPIDAVFVVDCSGSMGGPSIEDARRTLLLCLKSLEEGDRFEIVRFGSTHESLFGESRPYDDRSLAEADALARSMTADLGGTEILRPLQDVLGRSVAKGLQRCIVLLTDGQVSNDDEVIALARQHSSTTRFFSFGLGAGASDHLVRGVARASGGVAEMIAPGERIEDKVLRHVRRMAEPGAEDVRLEWSGLQVEHQTPSKLPPLYRGDALTVIGKVTSGTTGVATLSAVIAGESVRIEARVAGPDGDDASVAVVWAKRRIREIEEGEAWTGRVGSRQRDRVRERTEARKTEAENELVRLGTRYGLMSAATSYVVIDERAEGERAQESAELRQIPVMLTRGWGGIQGASAPPMYASARRSLLRYVAVGGSHLPPITEAFFPDDVALSADPDDFDFAVQRKSIPSPWRNKREGRALLLLCAQSADGSWPLDAAVTKAARVSLKRLQQVAANLGVAEAERILATAIVLLLVEDGRLPVQDAWRHIVEKGRRWLERATDGLAVPEGHADWLAWARSVLGKRSPANPVRSRR